MISPTSLYNISYLTEVLEKNSSCICVYNILIKSNKNGTIHEVDMI